MMNFYSFSDELEKIAGNLSRLPTDRLKGIWRLTGDASRDIHWRPGPNDPSSRRELLKKVRSELRGGNTFEVPLADRLKNYKSWKSTGFLGSMSEAKLPGPQGQNMAQFAGPGKTFNYAPKGEDVLIHTGGSAEALRGAASVGGRTGGNHIVLRPGDSHAQQMGLYTYTEPLPKNPLDTKASRYVTKPDLLGGEWSNPSIVEAREDLFGGPAMLELKVPDKYMIGGHGAWGGESFLQRQHSNKVLSGKLAPVDYGYGNKISNYSDWTDRAGFKNIEDLLPEAGELKQRILPG